MDSRWTHGLISAHRHLGILSTIEDKSSVGSDKVRFHTTHNESPERSVRVEKVKYDSLAAAMLKRTENYYPAGCLQNTPVIAHLDSEKTTV